MTKSKNVPLETILTERLRPIKGTPPDYLLDRLKFTRVFALVRVNLFGDFDILLFSTFVSVVRKCMRQNKIVDNRFSIPSSYYIVPFELPTYYRNK